MYTMTCEQAIKILRIAIKNYEASLADPFGIVVLDSTDVEAMKLAIRALQDQDLKNNVGTWLETRRGIITREGTWFEYYECPKCYATSLDKGNYCPNCGARMIKEEG